MKLAESPAPKKSLTRRPSRNPNTRPQIMPSGSPFTTMPTARYGAGKSPNRTSPTSATAMQATMARARRSRVTSDTTLMPTSFDTK